MLITKVADDSLVKEKKQGYFLLKDNQDRKRIKTYEDQTNCCSAYGFPDDDMYSSTGIR